jgi:hypothetical protein
MRKKCVYLLGSVLAIGVMVGTTNQADAWSMKGAMSWMKNKATQKVNQARNLVSQVFKDHVQNKIPNIQAEAKKAIADIQTNVMDGAKDVIGKAAPQLISSIQNGSGNIGTILKDAAKDLTKLGSDAALVAKDKLTAAADTAAKTALDAVNNLAHKTDTIALNSKEDAQAKVEDLANDANTALTAINKIATAGLDKAEKDLIGEDKAAVTEIKTAAQDEENNANNPSSSGSDTKVNPTTDNVTVG